VVVVSTSRVRPLHICVGTSKQRVGKKEPDEVVGLVLAGDVCPLDLFFVYDLSHEQAQKTSSSVSAIR